MYKGHSTKYESAQYMAAVILGEWTLKASLSLPKMNFTSTPTRDISTLPLQQIFTELLPSMHLERGTEDITVSKSRPGLCMHVTPSIIKTG